MGVVRMGTFVVSFPPPPFFFLVKSYFPSCMTNQSNIVYLVEYVYNAVEYVLLIHISSSLEASNSGSCLNISFHSMAAMCNFRQAW